MSDSGRSISRPEDGLSYEDLKFALGRLEAENEDLRRANEALMRQMREIQTDAAGNQRGPIWWCATCGSPFVGSAIDHRCNK